MIKVLFILMITGFSFFAFAEGSEHGADCSAAANAEIIEAENTASQVVPTPVQPQENNPTQDGTVK